MATFPNFIRKVGEEPLKVDFTPETTVGDIKAQHDLKGHAFRFKGPWKDNSKMVDLGIKAGETINVCGCNTSRTSEYKALHRLKTGLTKKSTAHAHIHKETQAVLVDAVMKEGSKTVGAIAELSKQMDEKTRPMPGEADQMRELLRESTSVLNAVLEELGLECRGLKVDKALCL